MHIKARVTSTEVQSLVEKVPKSHLTKVEKNKIENFKVFYKWSYLVLLSSKTYEYIGNYMEFIYAIFDQFSVFGQNIR